MLGSILLGICLFGLAFSIFMLYRSEWVYKTRTRILKESKFDGGKFIPYEYLPSYNKMHNMFWVWDVNKFLPPEYRK